MIIYSNLTPVSRTTFTEFFTPTSYFRPRKNALVKAFDIINKHLLVTTPLRDTGRVGRGIDITRNPMHLISEIMQKSNGCSSRLMYSQTYHTDGVRVSSAGMDNLPPSKVVNRHIVFRPDLLPTNHRARFVLSSKCYVNFMDCYGMYGKGYAYNVAMMNKNNGNITDEIWLQWIKSYIANEDQMNAFMESEYYKLHVEYTPQVRGDKLFHSFSTLLFAFAMWATHISVAFKGDEKRMIVLNTLSHKRNDEDDTFVSLGINNPWSKMAGTRTPAPDRSLPVVLKLDALQPIADATNPIIFDDSYLDDVCKYPAVTRSFIIACFAFYKPNSTFNFSTYAA